VDQTVRKQLLFLLVSLMMATGVFAQDLQGRNRAGACTGCHGTEGRSEGAIPPLAGMEKPEFVRLMTAFRDGQQPATVMQQLAKGLDDQQIDVLGEYFASRTPR